MDRESKYGCRQSGGGYKEQGAARKAGADECPEVSSICVPNNLVENPIMKNPIEEAFYTLSRSRREVFG
jgi:hypothetical protein